MNETTKLTYQYLCEGCCHRFEVVTTFREREPQPDETTEQPAGYPEQQPECPACHSHEVTRVEIHAIE